MNYSEVVSGVQERFGKNPPPADLDQIQRNRAMYADAVRAIQRRQEVAQTAPTCPACGGTGWADLGEIDGYHYVTQCDCEKVKASKRRMEESGLSRVMQECTFDSFNTNEEWQKRMARTCAAYVQAFLNADPFKAVPWLFLGGQSGSGKTHLCSAVVNKLLSENTPCAYITWTEEARKLKSLANDPGYHQAIKRLVEAKVLYIDDLFKSKNKTPPTDADVRIAFDILNGRSVRNLATIISSEWMLQELIDQDEATGGRIKERANGFVLNIAQDSARNYRL